MSHLISNNGLPKKAAAMQLLSKENIQLDRVRTVFSCIALLASSLTVLIIYFLFYESWQIISTIPFSRFLTDSSWNPTEGLYNLVPMIAGSLLAVIGAMALATPIGICLAIFSRFYAPKSIGTLLRSGMAFLAGVPSVVYGLWGITVLVPAIAQAQPPGASLFAAILTLAIMILPIVTLVADSSFERIPQSYLSGAAALGLTRWAVVKNIALPVSRSDLQVGVVLQVGRALGETMAVLMVCGNIVQFPSSLFDPVRTLTANIALEMAYATGSHRSALFLSGLILMGVIVLLVLIVTRKDKAHENK